jgi:TonB family protein
MRTVVPLKTTYLHAEALDGGDVEVPPRVLEEVRPTLPVGVGSTDGPWTVVLQFTVATDGAIRETQVIRSDDPRLATPAMEAIADWKVEPARRDGRPLPVVATVQLTFDPAPHGS